MTKGEHQVKTANNSFVDGEYSGIITFHVERANGTPAKIILHHFGYVPSCGMNILLRMNQLIQKSVHVDFNVEGATTILGYVLVHDAPLIKSLFSFSASTTSA
jgi:hypothetical protein